MTLRLLEARGTAYEVGYAIGSQAADLVRETVAVVCRVDLADEEVARRLGRVEQNLARAFPDVLDEARGLGDGAGIGAREALALTAVTELTGQLPGFCSVGAFRGRDGVLVGKNLDTAPGLRNVQVLERIAFDDGLAFLQLTSAGAMWTDGGVNEAGLALANASVETSVSNPDGVPDGIIAREVLRHCENVADAVAFVGRYSPMTLGENIALADADGRSAVIEMLPARQSVREGGTVVACNHALAAELVPLASAADPIRPNSERRLARLDEVVAQRPAWSAGLLAAALRDHEGGICQHDEDGLTTVASLIASPAGRWLRAAGGPPCESEYEHYELEGMAGEARDGQRYRGGSNGTG